MYKEIVDKITECENAIGKMGEVSQEYISMHDAYLYEKKKDAGMLKTKMIDKVLNVVNEN